MTEEEPCGGCAIRGALASGGSCPFTTETRRRGDAVCTAGEPAENVWLVQRGAVVLTRPGDGGDQPRTVRRGGTFVGLEALVRPTYLESARATTSALLCRAPVDQVDRWLGPPGTPARVALEQTLRAACDDTPRAAAADGSAVVRVARWLLANAAAVAGAEVPRRDVAGMLGIVPETMSRALHRLAATGAIAVSRRSVQIVDAASLRALAHTVARKTERPCVDRPVSPKTATGLP
jgi:CRP-like cAMP-binding protein